MQKKCGIEWVLKTRTVSGSAPGQLKVCRGTTSLEDSMQLLGDLIILEEFHEAF